MNEILSVLEHFRNDIWKPFGLKAGLYEPTLSNIAANYRSVEECFRECLSAWLRMKDNVKEVGVPTWLRLAEILEGLQDMATGDMIRRDKCKLSQVST